MPLIKHDISEVVIWGPNRGTFEMWIEYVRRNWQFLNLVPRGILATPELENYQFRRTRLIARSVNPNFDHHSFISHHPLTWFVSFLYESSIYIS